MERVIVVDDNEIICTNIKTVLEDKGMIVDIFTNPVEALSTFKTHCYDLAIVDIRMPQMNGFDVVKMFREERPAVAIIMLSSHIDDTDILSGQLLQHYCDLALSKPFSLEKLTVFAQELLQSP